MFAPLLSLKVWASFLWWVSRYTFDNFIIIVYGWMNGHNIILGFGFWKLLTGPCWPSWPIGGLLIRCCHYIIHHSWKAKHMSDAVEGAGYIVCILFAFAGAPHSSFGGCFHGKCQIPTVKVSSVRNLAAPCSPRFTNPATSSSVGHVLPFGHHY